MVSLLPFRGKLRHPSVEFLFEKGVDRCAIVSSLVELLHENVFTNAAFNCPPIRRGFPSLVFFGCFSSRYQSTVINNHEATKIRLLTILEFQ
mgnify:CR=1 FL=1